MNDKESAIVEISKNAVRPFLDTKITVSPKETSIGLGLDGLRLGINTFSIGTIINFFVSANDRKQFMYIKTLLEDLAPEPSPDRKSKFRGIRGLNFF